MNDGRWMHVFGASGVMLMITPAVGAGVNNWWSLVWGLFWTALAIVAWKKGHDAT